MKQGTLLAAIDLGSNSFRMVVAQILETPSGYQLRPVDTLRDSIKLAAGLDNEKNLDSEAYDLWDMFRVIYRFLLFDLVSFINY